MPPIDKFKMLVLSRTSLLPEDLSGKVMGGIIAHYFTLWNDSGCDPTFLDMCVEAVYVAY